MKSETNTFNIQLEQILEKEDLEGLDELVQNLSSDELKQHKTQLTEAYLTIYSIWYYDWICNKINTEDQKGFIFSLIEILQSAEKIDPDIIYYSERAECYKLLAEIETEQDEKLMYFQKAIDQYSIATKDLKYIQLNTDLANTLLDKLSITYQFEEAAFAEILQLFQKAFTNYSENVLSSFLHGCFRILNLPFEHKEHWHSLFIAQFNRSATAFAEKNPLVYLTWSGYLTRVPEYGIYKISPAYATQLTQQAAHLLHFVKEYTAENPELLNQLGQAFEKAAKQMDDTSADKLLYYQIALKHFKRGQELNPSTWTFPVYATNVLKAMAKLYYTQQNPMKVIELFETGKMTFSLCPERDFTLTLYWGEFLIEYARLAYDFNSPDILKEAESQLLIAKELGQKYYSHPYLALAKVALKLGNREKCLTILKECREVFTTEYSVYGFDPILQDEDFKEIWQDNMIQTSF